MSSIKNHIAFLFSFLLMLVFQSLGAQDNISWLGDYTDEVPVGSEFYQYQFTNVEKNDCKLKIDEIFTDKKGAQERRSWIFYLSDIDPSSVSFKAKGKAINISMETTRSQKFISYFEDGELDGYADELTVTMNEVEMARSFIETMKERINNCEKTQESWEDRDEAFVWLMNNVDRARDEEVEWEQKFGPGKRSYLVDLQAKSVDEKGEQEELTYTFDLSDIDPTGIDLQISGKSLEVELPVKEGKRFIQVHSPEGTSFTDEVSVIADNIESARQMTKALAFVVNNTTPERPQWDSYDAALEYIKTNLGEVTIGDEIFTNSITFEASPSGAVDFVIEKSESDGESEKVTHVFYTADLKPEVRLEVSKSSITLRMETRDDHDFIRETTGGKVSDYSSGLSFHVSEIDMARDILNALEYAISKSEEKITEFSSSVQTSAWLSENLGTVEIDGDKIEQKITVLEDMENQLIIEKTLTEDDGETTETRFLVYPEDISLEKLDVKVSGNEMSVPIATERSKFIKNYKNSDIQDFTGTVEVLFVDPLVAKNFIAAIRYLKEASVVEDRTEISQEEAIAFLNGNIQNLDLSGERYDQKFEVKELENCIVSFTRVETDDKGASDEYVYEFNVTDIHPENSKFATDDEFVVINLVTSGNKKLIKPYENGEADDFIDDFDIYVDDILVAKKTLAAFAALSRLCR